ncbi:MAG: winged helix-turn-helix domain-containing protein [Candidatus Thorarchaeota archaeon]
MAPRKAKNTTLTPNFKLWLEKDHEYVFGPGAYDILKAIHEEGTITKGAQKLGMSYRYAWGVIKKIERKVGVEIVRTFKGGSAGGGGAEITEYGLEMMQTYARISEAFKKAIDGV